jgi:large subunit ribosomal protein L28
MSRCEICGKGPNYARKVKYRGAFVTKRPKRKQKPNLQTVRIIDNGTPRKIKVCTRCLRSGKVQRVGK